MESIQHKLDRVRPPRVQITYDVEIGNAIVMRELPFVMGIMADLSGHPAEPLPRLKYRKFIEIDRDNFNDIMEKVSPRLTMRVDNKLGNEDSHLNIELFFKNMDDFNPLNVVQQIEPLRKLYEARTRLKDMQTKLDGNDALDVLLLDVMNKTETQKLLQNELGMTKSAAAKSASQSADNPQPTKPSKK